jgi:hypothetical protein
MPSSLTLTGADALAAALEALEAGALDAVGVGVLLVEVFAGVGF